MAGRRLSILVVFCLAACGYGAFNLEGVFYGGDVPREEPTLYLNVGDGNDNKLGPF